MSAPLVECDGTIVVGTSLDAASAVALRRAVRVARSFDAVIRLVYAVPWDTGALRVHEDELRRQVAEWARGAAKIKMERDMIACRLEEPATALAREALESHASLVILGASKPGLARGVADNLLRRIAVPVLVAQAPRDRQVVVAALDLVDKRYPVAHAAVAWADACAARVTLIHNIEKRLECREAKRKEVWPALRDLLFLTRSLGSVQRAHLSSGSSTPVAISELADARHADLVVVGARPSGGRTMGELLASTDVSVLVVPIEGRR